MPSNEQHIDPNELHLPAEPHVISVSVHEFVDSVGDAALRVDVAVEERPEKDWHWDDLKPIQDALFDYFRSKGNSLFPYVRFDVRSVSSATR